MIIRLHPKLEVEKTEGARWVLAEQARQMMEAFSALEVGEIDLIERFKRAVGGPR